jgi:phosphate transport system protein
MEQSYKEKREQLLNDLSDMSEIAEEMLQNAIKALNKRDIELARKVINMDDILDNYQITIEEEISRLFTLKEPLFNDSLNNLSIVKIASDLERIGDHSTNIAEIVLELKNEKHLESLVMIPELAEIVLDMLNAVLEAFATDNAELADAACRKDEDADNLNEQIYEHSLKLINKSEGIKNINQLVRFINIAKSLERIGDHATNIGEETILMITGKRVKY